MAVTQDQIMKIECQSILQSEEFTETQSKLLLDKLREIRNEGTEWEDGAEKFLQERIESIVKDVEKAKGQKQIAELFLRTFSSLDKIKDKL